jgi:CRISPR-associated endoribonuclease Cas6
MARLVLTLSSSKNLTGDEPFDKHNFQSAIYSQFKTLGIEGKHEGNRFRYFTFSDFFPSGPLLKGKNKKVIISSPDGKIIGSLAKGFVENPVMYLGNDVLDVTSVKSYNFTRLSRSFISGSPVVLYIDNAVNRYFSIRDGGDISFFLRRILENSVKKYEQFTGKPAPQIYGPLFDVIRFKKEVSVRISAMGRAFYIIGSVWSLLSVDNTKRIDANFYRFIMETGIGEKNSLGFGFLNPSGGE